MTQSYQGPRLLSQGSQLLLLSYSMVAFLFLTCEYKQPLGGRINRADHKIREERHEMSENDILLDNVSGEVIDYIRQLNFKKTRMGGYDKNHVLLNIQEICNIYEKHIAKIFEENKAHVEMLNNEIFELRQKTEALSRRSGTDPCIVEQANRAIAEANSRIAEANARICRLQAAYDEAESKLKAQEGSKQEGMYDNSRQVVEVMADARVAATEIIRHANEEADMLRYSAKNEADKLFREKTAELRAEERMHEERLDELREKYSKCRKYFGRMLGEIKDIEDSLEAMIKKQTEENVENIFNNVYKFGQPTEPKDSNPPPSPDLNIKWN